MDLARTVLSEFHNNGLTPAQRAAADLVVDFDAEETTCPACMTTFRPDAPMCPGCGLRFG